MGKQWDPRPSTCSIADYHKARCRQGSSGITKSIDITAASSNPFAALTLIAAPAVLTNACSVLVMSTSNRLGRSVDRARALNTILDKEVVESDEDKQIEQMYLKELNTVQARSVVLMKSLRMFYFALGGFASSAVVSLFGALLVAYVHGWVVTIVEAVALLVGMAGVCSLIAGCFNLFRETRLAVDVLEEQAAHVQQRVAKRIRETSGNK